VRGENRGLRRISRAICCLLCVTLLSACSVVRVTRPAVKIGLVGPFEGAYRYVGYDAIYAVRLALREANAAGGVGGYSVELVAYDDQGTISGARTAARNLTLDSQVMAVIGHFRDETTVAAREIYVQAGVPLIDSGTVEGWAGGQAGLLCPVLNFLQSARQGESTAERDVTAYQVQWIGADDVARPKCADDLSIVVSGQVPPPLGVSAVLLTLDPAAAGETVAALRETGWEGVIVGGPSLGSPLFTQTAGAAASDVLFATSYRWPELEGRDAEFAAGYQALGPHVPLPGPFALAAYQRTQALLSALEAAIQRGRGAAPTRQALAQALAQPGDRRLYVYRWTLSGRPVLIRDETLN
jgi:ABC-type branched-subunit amino acid transport system substrate-binding protein